eukprot:8089259-Ditylum_brightwellii.AAC.1
MGNRHFHHPKERWKSAMDFCLSGVKQSPLEEDISSSNNTRCNPTTIWLQVVHQAGLVNVSYNLELDEESQDLCNIINPF